MEMMKNNKSYNVVDIARYIINYSNDNNFPITNLKLQKLLYYVQANFLIDRNKPCFAQDIVHWRHGPVVTEAYSEFRKYFNDNISDRQKIDIDLIEYNDRDLIERVVKAYKDITPWDMVAKTHEETPWNNTERNEIMKNNDIKNYFQKNKNRLLSN